MDQWITACASVTGTGHHKSGIPCQDASAVKVNPTGEWVVIVASDGAGTAKRAEEGSALVAEIFFNSLLTMTSELASRSPGQWINDLVIEKVLETRKLLRAKAGSDDISDFNCTLVACLLGPNGGFSIHIGDGAIFGGSNAPIKGGNTTFDQKDFFISPPENGEYANETYFITERDWVKRLRITPMPKLDWVFACTDGGTALALASDKDPKESFILPVLERVLAEPSLEGRNNRLRNILENPEADKVTGDDKTIVIACRASEIGKTHSMPRMPAETVIKLRKEFPKEIVHGQLDKAPSNQGITSPKRWYQITPSNIRYLVAILTVSALAIWATLAVLELKIFPEIQFGNIFQSKKESPQSSPQPSLKKSQDNLENIDGPPSANKANNQTDFNEGQVGVRPEPPTSARERMPDTSTVPKASNTTEIQGTSNNQARKDSQGAAKPTAKISPQPSLTDTDHSTKKKADQKNPKGSDQ